MAYTGRIIRKLNNIKALSVLAAVVILAGLMFLSQHTSSIRILSVSFNTDGGSNIAPQRVTSGEAVVRPGNPVKDGYEFLYWELGDEEYDFSAKVTEDITLKAIYGQDDRYEIKLDFGDHVKTFLVADGIFEKPLDPTRDGYAFVYWELDGKEFDFSKSVSSDLTLVAKWEANDTGNEAYEPKNNPVVTTKIETETSIIEHKTVRQNDSTLEKGKEIVKQKGQNGEMTIIFAVTYKDDKETSRTETSRITIKQPVDEIILAGTKKVSRKQIDIEAISIKTEARTSVIAYKTVRQNDSTLEKGKTTVRQKGQNGEITITYTVTYTDGKETSRTEASRTINKQPVDEVILVGSKEAVTEQVDVTAPIITLLGNATEYVANGAVYIDAGATAADNVDGVITNRIVVAGNPVNTAKAGNYMVTYNVSDAAGNKAAEETRTVIVAEAIKAGRITVTPAILHKTDIFKIQATIFPENTTNKNIVWSSSKPSVVTVKDGEAELGDGKFRGIVIITATTVDGSKTAMTAVCFLSTAETRAFWSFNELYGRDMYERLDLTKEDDLRSVESIFFNAHFDRMAANLPDVEGRDIFLERYISFRNKLIIARAAFNDLQIARAQELISGALYYSMTQETTTDEATIKSTIESTIAREISTISKYHEITATVNKIDYTPAVPGDKINPAGINGTYTFTADLANSTATATTSNLTMTIFAAPYADHS